MDTSIQPLCAGRGALGSEYAAWRVPAPLLPALAQRLDHLRRTGNGSQAPKQAAPKTSASQPNDLAAILSTAPPGFFCPFLDEVEGVALLLAPSKAHKATIAALDALLHLLCKRAETPIAPLRSVRLHRPDAPDGAGLEPDAAYYFGSKALTYRALCKAQGAAAVRERTDFLLNAPPDMALEVEPTPLDAAKIRAYGALGVRELWLSSGNAAKHTLRLAIFSRSRQAYRQPVHSPTLGVAAHDATALVNTPEPSKMLIAGADYEHDVRAAAKKIRRRTELLAKADGAEAP